MRICFTGDLFLGGDLLNKDTKKIINIDLFNDADKRIVNLEQPISDNEVTADKCTLYTGSYAVKQLEELKINAVNLAHNHIQDKGLKAISETVNHLNMGGIGSFGAGKNLKEAKKSYNLDENIKLFGYCEYDKSYLKQITIANNNTSGVNPLRYKNIITDLDSLNKNEKAILYFHWGREHVFFPPYSDIELAKKLLKDNRVLLIVGMHPHRPQGYVEYNGKRAYMSLGNFLFPNFYIKPPTQIFYPKKPLQNYDITRQYHGVFKNTYKKWRRINRTSILLNFDTESEKVKHSFAIQDDNKPKVKTLTGLKEKYFYFFIKILSLLYKLPKFIYVPIERVNTFFVKTLWNTQIYIFLLRQMGIKEFFIRIKKK